MADYTVARRVKRYRQRLSEGRGLVRVEVMVPKKEAASLRRFAAELRNRAAARDQLHRLLDRAVHEFGPRCLWNVDLARRDEAMRSVIVSRLRKHGGHGGWHLASAIEQAARDAAT